MKKKARRNISAFRKAHPELEGPVDLTVLATPRGRAVLRDVALANRAYGTLAFLDRLAPDMTPEEAAIAIELLVSEC